MKSLRQLLKLGSSGPDVYVLTSGDVANVSNTIVSVANKADLVNGKVPLSQLPETLPEGDVEFIVEDV